MSLLKNKLKLKKTLKVDIEKEEAGKAKDTRFVNYSDLKFGEKMEVLIVPDVNGELWHRYSKHGANLGIRGLDTIACAYKSTGDDCPSCIKAFGLKDLEKEAKEAGDKTAEELYKKEAQLWFPKDYCIMSVLVLDSPHEIVESEDGNQIKLMYVPVNVQKIISNTIKEGILSPDEICQYPLVIKKEKNQYGSADYSQSYFARKPVSDDELSFFDDLKVEQFDYSNIDLTPTPTTTADVEKWLEEAEEKYEEKKARDEKATRGTRTERRSLSRNRTRDEDPDIQEDYSDREEEEQQEEQQEERAEKEAPKKEPSERQEEPAQGSESVRERLKRLRNANK